MLESAQKNEFEVHGPSGVLETDSSGGVTFHPPRLEAFNIPGSHEERLEWVKKSCERFFEKVRELDALLGLPELN